MTTRRMTVEQTSSPVCLPDESFDLYNFNFLFSTRQQPLTIYESECFSVNGWLLRVITIPRLMHPSSTNCLSDARVETRHTHGLDGAMGFDRAGRDTCVKTGWDNLLFIVVCFCFLVVFPLFRFCHTPNTHIRSRLGGAATHCPTCSGYRKDTPSWD